MVLQFLKKRKESEALKEADIVIDSLWNESPAGTFPAEAAFSGKPVLIGSYFADSEYHNFTKGIHIPPYCFVTPDNFFNELLMDCPGSIVNKVS